MTSCGSRKPTASWTTPNNDYSIGSRWSTQATSATASTKVDTNEIAAIIHALRFSDVEVGLDEDERALLTKLTS